ncbi:MAG: CoA transferase [Actinomycetota bacterium]|nr:CoA transferase [Actinomycetota bacterium]
MRLTLTGPGLSLATCARRLIAVGATATDTGLDSDADLSHLTLELPDAGGDGAGDGIDASVSWYGPAVMPLVWRGSEACVQALGGLMQAHGRDAGQPLRLGLEVASVAAGVLAAQGVLALLVRRSRGRSGSRVETSVLQAGLLQVAHNIADATCGDDWQPAPPTQAPGPPFRTSDGRWFEIETLDPEAWRSFWTRLGAAPGDLGLAWRLFRPRYFRGTCTLPPSLHEATLRHSLEQVAVVADACGVSLAPVRSYAEVLVEPPRWSRPVVEPLPRADGPLRPCGEQLSAGPSVQAADLGLPLQGLVVVEATSRMQGPLAGLLLQWLGASVIRVEPPGGDLIRTVPPLAEGTGSFFRCFNRGKQAVELDLASPTGRDELLDVVAAADVFLHNWRPGKAAAWRMESADLTRVNPGLIYAAASGWGPADLPLLGTDFLVQAYSAIGEGLHPEDEPPWPSRVLLTDFMGALVTCEGILQGLYLRERHGGGVRVGTSLLAGGLTLQDHVLEGMRTGRDKQRRMGRPLWGPLDRPLATAEGFLAVSVEDDATYRRLCVACGLDPDSGSRRSVEEVLARRLATRPAREWERLVAEAAIPCAAVATDLAALPRDARLAPLFEPLAGPCQAPGSPWRFPA